RAQASTAVNGNLRPSFRRPQRVNAPPIKVNKWFRLPVAVYRSYLARTRRSGAEHCVETENDMSTNWRISTFNGALLAAYFIPTWTIVAFKIMISPIHGFYERPNVSIAIFASDYLQLAATGTIRAAWLLALGRLTVVAFFAIFVA